MQLSVIIVNYNVKYFLEQCLHAVHAATAGMEAEVFVVDNASTDGSKEYLQPKFPQVKFRWLQQNIGFGKASNSVLPEASGNYILFLNPDTIIAEDSLIKCCEFFATNKACEALGVQMLDGNGRFLKESKRGMPTPGNSFFKMAGFSKLFPNSSFFSGYYAGNLPQHQNNPVDVLAGAFMMLSKKAIAASGGFDEAYFMYGEDVDLCYRLKKAGLGVYYFSETSILHFKGESTQRLSKQYIRNFYGAMWLFVKKHYNEKRFLKFLMRISILASSSLASLKLLLTPKQQPALNWAKSLTAVVAGQSHFNECLRLLQHAAPPLVIAGRISPQINDAAPALGALSDAPELIKTNRITQLVFCSKDLSFKAIIAQVALLAGKVDFLFHASGSESIVGSNQQQTRGIFIARNQQAVADAANPK